MQLAIINKLLKINQQFYQKIALSFSATRQNLQPGWEQLWTYLNLAQKPRTILDVGCGNGRFVDFLKNKLADFSYLGIDNNPKLLELARQKYAQQDISFQAQALVPRLQLSTSYDLIVCFAVLHHIPSFELRLNLLRQLITYLKPKGFFAISLWRFIEDEKLKNKIMPWSKVNLAPKYLEENDYLLSWGSNSKALRYCHYCSQKEIAKLKAALAKELKLIAEYQADGKTKQLNHYLIWYKRI